MKDEIDLLDLWRLIWKRRYFIGGFFLVAVIAALVISLLMPKVYKATATILPPMGIMGIPVSPAMEKLSSVPGSLTTKITPTDIFLGILKSRQMQDDIIDKFNLMEVYRTQHRESARAIVSSNTIIKISKEQMISISFIDTSPQRAAEVANFYVSNLDRLNRELNITKAGQLRQFLEKRLEETRQSLREAEEKLEAYRIKHKVAGGIRSASISTAGLEGQLIAKKIELEAKMKYTTGQEPAIKRLQTEINEIEKALAHIPPVENELARLIRNLKIQEDVYTILVRNYENAKIEEARDTPTVQVIDPAVVPEYKYKPKVKRNVMITAIIAVFYGVIITFVMEYYSRVKKV